MVKLKLINDNTVGIIANFEDLDRCKSVPGYKWDKVRKMWLYPIGALYDIHQVFDGEIKYSDDKIRDLYDILVTKQKLLGLVKEGKHKLDSHPFLMEHQNKCRLIGRYFNRFAYFLDTGTGKTITALQIIKDKGTKFLVVCPKAIIKTAWVEDQQNFFPELKLLPLSKNMSKEDYEELLDQWKVKTKGRLTKEDMKMELCKHADIYIINPESFKSDLKLIESLGIKGMVFDESTVIKNPQSQITKAITSFSDGLDYVYILSGKPAPNGVMDYFSQVRVVDPSILGESFFGFRNKYFYPVGYQGYDWDLKDGAEKEIAERIGRRAIFIRKEDCLDLPEKTYIRRMIELDTKALKYYKQMEKEQILLLEDTSISVPSRLASLMKLRQITAGFVLNPEVGETAILHKQKLNELDTVLEDIGDKQVIIWTQFKAEIKLISNLLQDKGKTFVTAYGGTKDVDDSIKRFKNGQAQYIIAHPATLKFGVTFTNCTYAIYYSQSYNYEEYYQSHDRIYRKGQTKPCTFIFLLAEGTIDEVIYKTLADKGSTSEILENMIRRK